MADFEKPSIPRQTSYSSPCLAEPLMHNRSRSDGGCRVALGVLLRQNAAAGFWSDNSKTSLLPRMSENAAPAVDKENRDPFLDDVTDGGSNTPLTRRTGCCSSNKPQKPSSLQSITGIDRGPESGTREAISSKDKHSSNVWAHSDDSDAAPASAWSTLPNRSLLFRPLPLDVGKCSFLIVKERSLDGLDGTVYSLYTNEGKGRKDRELALAHHRRYNGKSVFTIAQNIKGVKTCLDESFIGIITSNFMGSKYHIWDEGGCADPLRKQSKLLLAVVTFMPTIATWTGSYRIMRAWVPKYQSMQLKNMAQTQHGKGLPCDWETRKDRVHQLFSRIPHYNKISRHYELDYSDKGRDELPIQRSVKNFQLILGEGGKQTILQLGRVGKSKYVMDYRHPLTGYQAFGMCLASMDSKLCCTV